MFKGFCTFLIIDIVDSSNQFEGLMDHDRQSLLDRFFRGLEKLARKRGFLVIDKPGDAAVLVDRLSGRDGDLLALIADVYIHKRFPNISLRAVAHHVFLRFKRDDAGIPIYSGKEVLRTFRSEKAALKWELLVSEVLFQSLDEELLIHKVTASGVIKGHDLTGHKEFQNITEVRRLQFPIKLSKTTYHRHFVKKRRDLFNDVQKIKVFGGLYPDVDMADSFINLSLEASYEPNTGRGLLTFHHRLEDRFGGYQNGERVFDDRHLTAIDLIDRFNKGLILGLPGAGKTTLLHNLAFRLLSDNQDLGLIFIKCRDLDPNTQDLEDDEAVFGYLTRGYVGKGVESSTFAGCAKSLIEAWSNQEAVILIDALDEAPNQNVKRIVLKIFEKLQQSIQAKQESELKSNRIFLTSRPAEFTHHQTGYPVFHVNALDSGQITDLAWYFLGENDEIFKEFRIQLPKAPYAVIVGSTPLTALLITVWYQAYRSFELRYATYDLLMKFALHRTWDLIKSGDFSRKYGRDLKPFLDEIKENSFDHVNPQAHKLYELLAKLSFVSLYERVDQKRDIGKKPLRRILETWLRETEQAVEPEQWIQFLKDHHILVSAGHERFQFIHSTIMEFLAARDLVLNGLPEDQVRRACDDEHQSLETLPVGCSADHTTAYRLLRILREHNPGQVLNLLAYRCLVETEALEHKQIKDYEFETLMINETERLDSFAGDAKVWIYEQLGHLFKIKDKSEIDRWRGELENRISLCRDTFADKHLPKNWLEDETLIDARKQLFIAIYNQTKLDSLVLPAQKQPPAPVPTAVQPAPTSSAAQTNETPSPTEHPLTQDYRKRVGPALIQVIGIPRMSHHGEVSTVAFDPTGTWLASGGRDGTVRLWASDGTAGPVLRGHERPVRAVAWGPEGWLASGGGDGTVRLWAGDGTAGPVLRGHKGAVQALAWGPEGRLASGGSDGTVRLWASDGTAGPVLRGHKRGVQAVAWGPAVRLASGGDDWAVRLWAGDGTAGPVLRGHERPVRALAWGPEGRLASGGDDGTVRLWASDGAAGPVLRGYGGWVRALAWGPEGRLASGGDYGTVRLWDVDGTRELARVDLHSVVVGLAFDPGGSWRMATANYNTVIAMIDWSKVL